MALAGAGAAAAFLPFLVFASAVGIGLASDSFFAALTVTQTVQAVLFAPFDFLLPGALLGRRDSDTTSLWAALLAWASLSVPAIMLVIAVGPMIGGPLFGTAVRGNPEQWQHHLIWLGVAMPLNGVLLVLQFHAQALGRLDLPKLAILVGRLIGVGAALLAGSDLARWMGAVLNIAPAVSCAIILLALRPAAPAQAVAPAMRRMLREWLGVTRWASVLRTDVLVDRALAANLATGFLSAFNLAWVAVMNVAEAFQGSFAAADARRLHALRAATVPSPGEVREAFRDSTRAAWLLTAAAFAACSLLEIVGARWLGWTGWAPSLTPAERVTLLLLVSIATAIFCFWKQVATRYSVEGRAADFARLLAITFVIFLLPRLAATRAFGVYGFCLTLALYYGAQVVAALRDVQRQSGRSGTADAATLPLISTDHDTH